MALGVTLAVQQPIDNPVTRTKLNDLVATATGTVTGTLGTTQIENGAVTEPKIGAAAVTAEKIADGSITAAKIASGVMTAEALVAAGSAWKFVRGVEFAVKTAAQTSTLFSTWEDVTGLSVTLTLKTAGAKVILLGSVFISGSGVVGIRVLRGSTVLSQGDASGSRTRAMASGFEGGVVPIVFVDAPGTEGPHTYKVQFIHAQSYSSSTINVEGNDSSLNFTGVSTLAAIELNAIPD